MKPAVLIRYGAYPVVFGSAVGAVLLVANTDNPWPGFALVAVLGIAAVALLERLQPYEPGWLEDHGDTLSDALHVLVNLAMLAGTAYALHALGGALPKLDIWPLSWPLWGQVVLAGAIIDAGLYAMHRLSHHVDWLWRLHAVHHGAERLYWMNGERRHPLSALVLATPGIACTVGIGAPPLVISAWFTLLSVHLAFQHANLDYRLGPFRRIFGVAEVHRWHHKRDYKDSQVNFGEFWMLWDRLFGTYRDHPGAVRAGDVGLGDKLCPKSYWHQLRWPFQS